MPIDGGRLLAAFEGMKRAGMLLGRSSGLPPGEFFVLTRLGAQDGADISISDLQAGTPITMSAVSQVVTSLERKGLVTREMSRVDRRRIAVSITKEGEDRLLRARRDMHDRADELIARFGEEDASRLVALMERLGGVVEQMWREMGAQGKEEGTCSD